MYKQIQSRIKLAPSTLAAPRYDEISTHKSELGFRAAPPQPIAYYILASHLFSSHTKIHPINRVQGEDLATTCTYVSFLPFCHEESRGPGDTERAVNSASPIRLRRLWSQCGNGNEGRGIEHHPPLRRRDAHHHPCAKNTRQLNPHSVYKEHQQLRSRNSTTRG